MTNNSKTLKDGEELNQLSRLLFNRSAFYWYSAMAIEFEGGVIGVFVGILDCSGTWRLVIAVALFILLAYAYYLKIRFQYWNDTAETMRRQSVLAEALEWPIEATQFSDWRLRAGARILKKFKVQPRDEDYYTTQRDVGPQKLLDMTIESAFYTRHLYVKLKNWARGIFATSLIIWILILSIVPIDLFNNKTRLELVCLLYLFLPLIISLDVLGWSIKLGRISQSIKEIEVDMERLSNSSQADEIQVMRLVSEYNCQVVTGVPILNVLFNYWHDEIKELWDKRSGRS